VGALRALFAMRSRRQDSDAGEKGCRRDEGERRAWIATPWRHAGLRRVQQVTTDCWEVRRQNPLAHEPHTNMASSSWHGSQLRVARRSSPDRQACLAAVVDTYVHEKTRSMLPLCFLPFAS
jgi:hypothetical protein